MWVGQQRADGLDFWGFLGSLILGGIILGIYTGLLGYVGAKTGLSSLVVAVLFLFSVLLTPFFKIFSS